MDLKIRHLRLLQALDRERSVSGAARRLRLSQPAVSQGLRELENLCGQRLFERSRREWRPTVGGRRLLRAADQVLATLECARHDLELIAAGTKGVLRLATECYTGYHWLPPVLARFRASHPDWEVRIVPEATRQPVEWLRRRELDLAITHSPHTDDDLRAVPLFADELVAVLHPDHPLVGVPFLEPRHFANQELILHSDPDSSVVVSDFLRPAGVEPRRVSELQLTEAVLSAVRAGLGISVLARWAVAPEIEAGHMVAKPLSRRGLHRQWSATTLVDAEAPEVLGSLVEALKSSPLAGHDASPPRVEISLGSTARLSR